MCQVQQEHVGNSQTRSEDRLEAVLQSSQGRFVRWEGDTDTSDLVLQSGCRCSRLLRPFGPLCLVRFIEADCVRESQVVSVEAMPSDNNVVDTVHFVWSVHHKRPDAFFVEPLQVAIRFTDTTCVVQQQQQQGRRVLVATVIIVGTVGR